MNEQQTRLIAPIGITVAAAALTFIPMPYGGIRIIQALWLTIGLDSLAAAALVHGLTMGGFAYLIVSWSRRRDWSLDGNFVAIALFGAYVVAYFAVGIPMVA